MAITCPVSHKHSVHHLHNVYHAQHATSPPSSTPSWLGNLLPVLCCYLIEILKFHRGSVFIRGSAAVPKAGSPPSNESQLVMGYKCSHCHRRPDNRKGINKINYAFRNLTPTFGRTLSKNVQSAWKAILVKLDCGNCICESYRTFKGNQPGLGYRDVSVTAFNEHVWQIRVHEKARQPINPAIWRFPLI